MSESGAWYRRSFVSGDCRRASAQASRYRWIVICCIPWWSPKVVATTALCWENYAYKFTGISSRKPLHDCVAPERPVRTIPSCDLCIGVAM